MSDEPASLILEHLKHIRRKVDVIDLELGDVKSRVSALEETQGQMLVLLGVISKRLDRHDERFARIERRLDLVEV
jgi:hypothetical protein